MGELEFRVKIKIDSIPLAERREELWRMLMNAGALVRNGDASGRLHYDGNEVGEFYFVSAGME